MSRRPRPIRDGSPPRQTRPVVLRPAAWIAPQVMRRIAVAGKASRRRDASRRFGKPAPSGRGRRARRCLNEAPTGSSLGNGRGGVVKDYC